MHDPIQGRLDSREELLTAFPPLLIVAGTLATRAGNKHIFGPFELTVHHYALLQHVIGEEGGCKMADLRGVMFNSAANITQHVDALEARRLVCRVPSPNDRRVTLIQITGEGRALLRNVEDFYQQQMVEFMREQATDDLATVTRVLRQFIQRAFEAMDEDPPALLHHSGSNPDTQESDA